MKKYEGESINNNNSITRLTLTKPAKGQNDIIKDTTSTMTIRRNYLKKKLIEKRTYTQTGSVVYAHRTDLVL